MRHVLYGYLFQVLDRDSGEAQLLGNFDDHRADILTVFEDFCKGTSGTQWTVTKEEDEGQEMTGSVVLSDGLFTKDKTPPITKVAGKFKAGVRGVRLDIYDTNIDIDTPAFKQMPPHVSYFPTLAFLNAPGSSTVGHLILHQYGPYGVKTLIWREFLTWFSDRYPDYRLRLDACFPEGWYKELLTKEQIPRITLTKWIRPTDAFDARGTFFEEQQIGEIRTVITPARRGSIRKKSILDVINHDADVASLLTVGDLKYDRVAATVSVKGKQLTFSLNNERTPRLGWEIENVKLGTDGHVDNQSLYDHMIDYVNILNDPSKALPS